MTAETNYRAIRTQTHKLIRNYNDAWELYDLESDPDELTNLAEDDLETRWELERRMIRRFNEGGALR